jgi:hydroxypyruvate isomerase
MRFSANLGFLWADRPLAHAIHAAADAGFDAVECHWPFAAPASEVSAALATTGLPMIGLNTSPGDRAAGEFGLAALPGREGEARAAIDEAIAYAAAVGARHVHVMAGHAEGPAAEDAFLVNLDHACRAAAPRGIGILIEPLNRHDAPGYFLATTGQAEALIDRLGAPNLRLMFDCYHVQRTEGDLTRRLAALFPKIGHIQFASVPDRGPPDGGEVDYAHVFAEIAQLGWTSPLGAEYRPRGATEATLGWLAQMRGTATPAGER